MKKCIGALCMLFVLFALAACGPSATPPPTDFPASSHAVSQNTACPNETYDAYAPKVSAGLSRFRQLIAMDIVVEPPAATTLIVETRIVEGISSQGARITRFMTSQNEIARYTLHVLGETGQVVEHYTYCDGGVVYIQYLELEDSHDVCVSETDG